MKILHLVPYLPKASGVTTFVVECSDELQRQGVDQVVAVKDMVKSDVAPSSAGVPRVGTDEAFSRIGEFDIVHIHGIWPPFMHRFVVPARRRNIPIVWSLHGMLSPWAMKYRWWKKVLPWFLWQKRDLHNAALLHVTSEKETTWAANLGFTACTVVPLGTGELKSGKARSHALLEKRIRGPLTILFVGRINPIKGLDNLVRAAALLSAEIRFRIVGTDASGYQSALIDLAKELGVDNRFDWAGPKYGDELRLEYANADALILPSHTENFGGVVIDALAWGLPVITSKGTPWQEVEGCRCGWWVENNPESLAKALREFVSLSEEERRAMGARGQRLVEAKYTWSAVAEKMRECYLSLFDKRGVADGK